MSEVWKQIPGASLYEASTEGRIRVISNGRVLRQFRTMAYGSGYVCCRIKFDSGLISNRLVHRLIACTFLTGDGVVVNHLNGIKDDNRVVNLKWCTHSQNSQHAYDTGLKKYRPLHYRGKFGSEHNRSKSVVCSNGCVYGSMSEAERKLKLSGGVVSKSIIEHRPTRGGLLFTLSNK